MLSRPRHRQRGRGRANAQGSSSGTHLRVASPPIHLTFPLRCTHRHHQHNNHRTSWMARPRSTASAGASVWPGCGLPWPRPSRARHSPPEVAGNTPPDRRGEGETRHRTHQHTARGTAGVRPRCWTAENASACLSARIINKDDDDDGDSCIRSPLRLPPSWYSSPLSFVPPPPRFSFFGMIPRKSSQSTEPAAPLIFE